MAEESDQVKRVSTERAYDGRIIKVYLDELVFPDGKTATWERVVHPGAVGMVPLMEDGTVLMVRQYRNAVDGGLLEIPAGKLDRPEEPVECAHRELIEEVGHRAGLMTKLAEFYNSPGYSDEYFYLYLARELSPEHGESEPYEFLSVERYTLGELMEMIASGGLKDAKSIIGVALASLMFRPEAGPSKTDAR